MMTNFRLLPFIIFAISSAAFAQQEGETAATASMQKQISKFEAAKVDSGDSQQPMTASQFSEWLKNLKAKQKKKHAAGMSTAKQAKTPAPPPLTYEEGQQAMLETVPQSKLYAGNNTEHDAAFKSLLQQNMPLSPKQIVQLRQQIDVTQRASAVPPNIPPKSVSSTIMVNLAPGATPPAVRLAQGYVSSLVFIDSTGTPWPIAAFDVGNPKAVNIQWDGKSNILLLQAVAPYAYGDIVIRLVGLPTPITLEMVSGQRVVDYRVDLHVSGIGPNTKEMPIGTDLPNGASQLLLGVLDGVAPAGARQLHVPGTKNEAWLLGDRIYLRTRFTVLSPGWIGKMTSPDGMQAYELPKTSTILISRFGDPVQLKIEGF